MNNNANKVIHDIKTQFSTRRHFLKTSLILGATPLMLPCGLRGADTAPSRQITLGFVGTGKQFHALLDACLSRDDTRVLAVCDVVWNQRRPPYQTRGPR